MLRAFVQHLKRAAINQKVMLITLISEDILYSFIMYRIGRDKNGVLLLCLACTHTERVQDFNGDMGNQRTLAAHAMLKHVHAAHSRETHVRAMAMVMERQNAPRQPSRT